MAFRFSLHAPRHLNFSLSQRCYSFSLSLRMYLRFLSMFLLYNYENSSCIFYYFLFPNILLTLFRYFKSYFCYPEPWLFVLLNEEAIWFRRCLSRLQLLNINWPTLAMIGTPLVLQYSFDRGTLLCPWKLSPWESEQHEMRGTWLQWRWYDVIRKSTLVALGALDHRPHVLTMISPCKSRRGGHTEVGYIAVRYSCDAFAHLAMQIQNVSDITTAR